MATTSVPGDGLYVFGGFSLGGRLLATAEK
jgi:hypothetical protein